MFVNNINNPPKMVKLMADYGTYGLWILSTREAILDFVQNGDIDLLRISTVVSLVGIVYTIVLIVNKILDGRVNREQTRLENEKILREIYELDEYDLDADKE